MLQNPLRGSVAQFVTFAGVSQNCLGPLPIHYVIVIRYPQQMVQMAFCDLSHTFHEQVANVSQHVFVILLWGILMSPLIVMFHVDLKIGPRHHVIFKGRGPLAAHLVSVPRGATLTQKYECGGRKQTHFEVS